MIMIEVHQLCPSPFSLSMSNFHAEHNIYNLDTTLWTSSMSSSHNLDPPKNLYINLE